ncbi:hypothetical protein ACFX16_021261 [Malus domestica]
MGIKLDMHKAYDRVEWDFLEVVMEKMGFCTRWSSLVMGCVKSVDFVVILNGQPGRRFVPSRVIRQGDPLSPYLFVLVSEVLSMLIQVAIDRRDHMGICMNPPGSVFSHLFFADDTLIFLRADRQNCDNLVKILDGYCLASGQQVNLHKSCIFFGANIPRGISAELSQVLGMHMVDDPVTYLGLASIWNRSKKQGLAYIKGRILEKIPRLETMHYLTSW